MTGFTDRTSQAILGHIVGKTAMFTMPTAYLALFTAVGGDNGVGFTEVTGGAYARVQTAAADWNAASGSAPSLVTNANVVAFPTPTLSWGTVIAFGLFDAATGGNLLAWDYLGNFIWLPATVSAASPALLSAHGHGFAAGDTVIWSSEYGGVMPTFSQSNFTGQLLVTAPSADSFSVTNAGTAVNTSATGNGNVRKILAQPIGAGATPSFSSGALTITSA